MNPKNLIKPVLYILGGAALGGGVSYFFAHREIRKLKEEVNNFVESMNIDSIFVSDPENVVENFSDKTIFKSGGSTIEITDDHDVTINASIQKPAILELMEKVSNAAQLPAETMFSPITVVDNEPFLIGENSIDLNDDKYDSEVAYTYYEDGILTDENDDPVIDPDDILPSGWRDCFGWNCRSDDTFFAINPKLRLLIEVGRAGYKYGPVYGNENEEE